MTTSLAQTFLFLLAVSLDSLTAGLSYGASKVRIRTLSAIFLIFIPSITITLMTQIGSFFFSLFSAELFSLLSFTLLFLLGCMKLLESLIRHYAEKYPGIIGKRACQFKQLNIILTIYFSPEDANKQDIQVLSPKEAFFLSLALSLDSMIASMAFSCQVNSFALFFLLAVFFQFLLFFAGFFFGLLLSSRSNLKLSWLSGLFLLLLAFCTLL